MKHYIGYLFSKPNKRYNISKFMVEYNILFITGLSGSGKTTLSLDLSKKYNAIVLNLDCLCNYYNEKFNNTLIKCLTGNFLKNNAKLDEILKNEEFMDLKLNRTSEYIFYIKSYFEYVYKFCLDYKNINFIIEGTQLFMTLNPLIIFVI